MLVVRPNVRYHAVLVVGLVVMVATGCGPSISSFETTEADQYEAVPADSVTVFAAPDSVPGEWVELAELEGEGSAFVSEEDFIGSFQEKAGELGANGLILRGFASRSLLGRPFGSPKEEAKATAIYYDKQVSPDE